MDISAVGITIAIVSMLASVATAIFAARQTGNLQRQLAELRRELEHQSLTETYRAWLEWDVLLLREPELFDVLNDSSSGPLDPRARALAQYRLDLAELIHLKHKYGLYRADEEYLERMLSPPLMRKALADPAIRNGLRRDFVQLCDSLLLRATKSPHPGTSHAN